MVSTSHLDNLPNIRITIGDVRSSASPMVIKTLLGSCVAVCLYDPVARMGGLNHISLPGNSSDIDSRFGVHAMEILINQLMGMGCSRKRLAAKAFGGGNILSCIKAPVGDRNADFVKRFLSNERIPLLAERLGGPAALEVYFRTDTGYVLLRRLNTEQEKKVKTRERILQKRVISSVEDLPNNDDVVLF